MVSPSNRTSVAGSLDDIARTLAEMAEAAVDLSAARALVRDAATTIQRLQDTLVHYNDLAERARLDGALLVARTAAHQLNNALAPVVGYAELLATLPQVSDNPTARSYATLIGESARTAAEILQRLQRIVRLAETPSALGRDKPLLDLERSTS